MRYPRRNLTELFITKLKPPAVKRDFYPDAIVPRMEVQVTDKGSKSFGLRMRFPRKPQNPAFRVMGKVGQISLAEARETGRAWNALVARGIDPAEEEERQRSAARVVQANTLGVVAEAFIARKLPGERKARAVAREIRNQLVEAVLDRDWGAGRTLGEKPITEITDFDMIEIIQAKAKTAPAQARNLLGHLKRFFKWVKAQRIYGITVNPCADLSPRDILGERASGERVLANDEFYAFWHAAAELEYPCRQVYELLALNALRLNEVARASWPEFDFAEREWVIPASRMKGKEGKARPHVVPLTDEALKILGTLPEFKAGPFLFSTTGGMKPVTVGSKIKAKLDRRMLAILRDLASERGNDPGDVVLEPFVNHDIRRTVRSNLPALKNAHNVPVADEVSEAILAHVQPGIRGVYNRHKYLDQKREALTLWAARLEEIVEQKAATVVNVIPYHRGRATAAARSA